jgi:biopolymer transport protein ExbB
VKTADVLLVLLLATTAFSVETDLPAAATAARTAAEAQLAATRQDLLSERTTLTARLQDDYRRLATARDAAETAARDRLAAEDELRRRRLEADRDLKENRQLLTRLLTAAQLGAEAPAESAVQLDAAKPGLAARLARLGMRLGCVYRAEEVFSRRGVPASVPVLRLGGALAVACGNDHDTRGLLADAAGRPKVSGPRLGGGDLPEAGVIPFLPEGAGGEESQRLGLVGWFRSGGFFMWAILLVGLAGLVIILDRLWWLNRTRCAPGLVDRVLVSVNTSTDVAPLLAAPLTPLHRVLAAGVASLAQPRPAREAALEQALLAEQSALERGLSLLAVLAATAPLLGLLGTVTGMIGMFQTIAGHGAGNLRLLSGSISIALVTTQFGLLTAVPLLLSHAWLARVVERRQALLDEAASGFLGQEREARP